MTRSVRSTLTTAVLLAAAAVAPSLLGAPTAALAAAGDAYSLSATVSPAPLTGAECAADPACVAAPAPSAGPDADDEPTIRAAVSAAAGHAVAAVVDGAGTVIVPARQGTVLLAAGTYRVARPVQLPPNVNLRGAGITATTVLLAPAGWRNFGYSFLITPKGNDSPANDVPGSANLVSDLTVNGSCKIGAGAPDPTVAPSLTCDLGASTNYGGGVKAGNRWTVRQIRFTNLNYFKLWIARATGVTASDNRFDLWGGAGSGDEDNIGGGSNASHVLVEHNQWDETIRGNGMDLTNASHVTFRNNTIHATREYLDYRAVGDYGSVYLEGVTDSTVADNAFHGAHLVLQSNSSYAHIGENVNVTNARNVTVRGNQFVGSFWAGITVNYDNYDPEDGHIRRPGGGNVITGNTITRPAQSGILVFGRKDTDKTAPDVITDNTIVNAGYGGSTYYAGFDTTGVGLSIGSGDTVSGNTVIDDQVVPTTWYGVHIGARSAVTSVTGTVLSGNTGTGLIGGLYRQRAAAPEAPTLLVAAGSTLTWRESYPLAGRPIAGYRVYRNGLPVADLAPGSADIPGNLYDAARSSVESGLAGWTAGPRTAVSWRGDVGAVGTASIAVTATGAGQIAAYGPVVPVAAGASYTTVASFQGPAARRVRAGIAWLDATGAVILRVTSGNPATTDAGTGWMTSSYTANAPVNAVAAQAFLPIDGALVGETHLVDRIGLAAGSVTEMWTDPAPPAGPNLYQVVAYRAGDGELSSSTGVTVG